MVNGTTVTLGPITNAEHPLPADAGGELVITRISPAGGFCGGPPSPVGGLIIDDLRSE
jgi:hypothetical protein